MKTETVIAANRFGLGARPGDLESIDRDPRSWLLDQLQGPSRQPSDFRKLPQTPELILEAQDIRRMQRETRQRDDQPAPDVVQKFGAYVRRNYIDQIKARYRVAARSDFPFYERLVHFWSNHFAVSADKPPIPAIAGLYEIEAIRPNIAGNFADLLIAAEQHPAMILYLDNQRSIGPGSTMGKRANRYRRDRRFGLNENLAREILELHTLGVDGGYGQDDVTTFAKVITGWSIGGVNDHGRFADGEAGTFEFREAIHEPGTQTVLGRNYSQQGLDQGEAVLRDLAMHPSTATFISTKLARHFVADDPPQTLVDRLSNVFLDSGGDLVAMYTALVESTEPWQHLFSKYKTPHDYVVSAFRAFDHAPDDGRFLIGALDLMGQAPFKPGSPEGWPDTADQWGGADALYKRIEWAEAIGNFAGSRVNPLDLGDTVLGPAFSARTRKAVSRADSTAQGTTLFLASPDFQRR
ncbi:MAG: DUF1800 domain-containing protein [Woeseiaceae bacterium]|nr:DUF1800 domain-containing protein [Woeseiaceae bacterium]